MRKGSAAAVQRMTNSFITMADGGNPNITPENVMIRIAIHTLSLGLLRILRLVLTLKGGGREEGDLDDKRRARGGRRCLRGRANVPGRVVCRYADVGSAG